MRISTAGIHNAAIARINERTAELVRTQNQIASGKRILTPADDPLGTVQALQIDRALSQSQQYGRNADAATNRLSLEEQTLADATALLQRVRDLTVQANSGALDQTSRESIATELEVRLGELVDLANRRDSSGEYIFSGYSTLTQPFSRTGNAVSYMGDQGTRQLQTGPGQFVADSHPGSEVFLNIPQGNGTFVTAAAAANTGSGVIDGGSVTDKAAWDAAADTYAIQFTSATTYQVLDSSSNVVSTGTYTSGAGIAFSGIQVAIQGTPAAGDSFTVSPSGRQDMFSTLADLLTTLKRPSNSEAQNALVASELGGALNQIDRSLERISSVRAEVGARLSVLSDAADAQADRELELKTSLSSLRDLDYADAVARLNVQLAGLQAAQQSYASINQLSLFDYL